MIQDYILGGYTRRVNEGISVIQLNTHKGTFRQEKASLISPLDGPTYMTLSKDKNLLFALHKENDKGGVVVFRRDSNNDWHRIAGAFANDGSGCHIAYCDDKQIIYIANYHSGDIDVYSFQEDQVTHIQNVKHEGSSVHKNQDNPHVHYVGFNDVQSLLYVCDLGTDYVSTYNILEDGSIELSSQIKLAAGTGPRHLVHHPHEPYIYILGELANTTTIVSVDARGEMVLVDTVQNIEDQYVEESAGAAIRVTKDGKFLYTSTRFHNVITVYAISENGSQLTKVQEIDTRGEIPRDFILDKLEQHLLVPHQDSDYISVFSRDQESGLLEFLNNDTYAPECTCIVFAK